MVFYRVFILASTIIWTPLTHEEVVIPNLCFFLMKRVFIVDMSLSLFLRVYGTNYENLDDVLSMEIATSATSIEFDSFKSEIYFHVEVISHQLTHMCQSFVVFLRCCLPFMS